MKIFNACRVYVNDRGYKKFLPFISNYNDSRLGILFWLWLRNLTSKSYNCLHQLYFFHSNSPQLPTPLYPAGSPPSPPSTSSSSPHSPARDRVPFYIISSGSVVTVVSLVMRVRVSNVDTGNASKQLVWAKQRQTQAGHNSRTSPQE